MAISQGGSSSVPVGLRLKAWAFLNGVTGARLDGSLNVTSAVRSLVGVYTLTLTGGMLVTDLVVVQASMPGATPGVATLAGNVNSATSVSVSVQSGGALADSPGGVHVAIYGP